MMDPFRSAIADIRPGNHAAIGTTVDRSSVNCDAIPKESRSCVGFREAFGNVGLEARDGDRPIPIPFPAARVDTNNAQSPRLLLVGVPISVPLQVIKSSVRQDGIA